MEEKTTSLLKNILLLVVSLALFSLVAEIVLRSVLPTLIVWKIPQEKYRFDSQTGHWLAPDQQAFTHSASVSTNSEGLRDRDYLPYAATGVVRILALGDSQTFGNGIELDETWPKRLETVLNDTAKNKYEVINAGLAASDTWQHEIILKRLLPKYNPDVVILAFYVNDVVKKYVPSPELKQNREAGQSRLIYALKKSALLMSLRTAYDTIKIMVSPSKGFLAQQALLRGEDLPVLKERWQQVSNSIASMKQMSDAYRTKFIIISLPRRDQVDGRTPWDGYYGKLESVAKQFHVPIFSMLEPLQAAYLVYGRRLFIPWDGHNTVIANQAIAESISKQLLK